MNDEWFDIQNAPINKLKKRTLKLAGSRRVMNDQGLTIFSVEGTQQGGKSTYGMRMLMDMYGNEKDVVLSRIVMSAEDFRDDVQAALHGNFREIAMMWDDMSVGGAASTWVTDPYLVKKLSGLGDTLGIAVKCLIMTSPSGDMIKAFRNYNKYKVIIHPGRHKYERIAYGYRMGKSPMNQRWCSLEFQDTYDVRIPFYDEYAQKRRDLSIKAVQAFNETPAKEEKEKPITITATAKKAYHKWEEGHFGKVTLKQVCKIIEIPYQTMCNVAKT